jgi:lysozyme
VNVPGRDTVVGIDVSRWQGTIDWDQVAPTISFAFLKSTGGDGGLYRDPSFTRNAAEASRVSVPWGTYHFASRMAFAAEVEARYFCDQIRGTGWTLPPVLDWEPSPGVNGTQALAWVLAFCAEVERQLGVRPIIYTGAYVSLDRGDALKAYDLWLAAYTPQPIRCAPWDTWTIWQYTSSARLPGITANTVDMNLADRSWLDRFTHPQPDNEEEELMAAIDDIRAEFVNQDTRTRAALEKQEADVKEWVTREAERTRDELVNLLVNKGVIKG